MREKYGAFTEHFVTMFAPEILNICLRQVELYVSNQAWLSKCQYQIFTFFDEWYVPSSLSCRRSLLTSGNVSVKPKSTWTLLKPLFENLVSTFVFAQLSFNHTKKALWENDPVDHIFISVGTYTHTCVFEASKVMFFTRRIRGTHYTRITVAW